MGSVEAVRVFYGVTNDTWAVVHAQLGQPDMRILAALPPEALVENVMTARFADGASLNPTQAVQIGLVWRLCRRIAWTKWGGDYEAWADVDPWAKPPTPPALRPRRHLQLQA